MGWSHDRDQEATGRGNAKELKVPSAPSVRAAKPLLCLYIEDTVQKVESRDYTRLQKMVVQYLEHKNRGKHCSSRGRQHEKPASGAAAAKRSV